VIEREAARFMSDAPILEYARTLLGKPGSRYAVATPALILDVDVLDRNIHRMAERAQAAKLQLRPHAKSHKCSFIAKRQIAAGAVGVCCAKLGEAEALAEAGVDSILITSPIAGELSAQRAVQLAGSLRDFRIVVDHPAQVAWLDLAAREANLRLDVLIDVDVGFARTGVANPAAAVALAQAIRQSSTLRLRGVQGYGGHLQHLPGFERRRSATEVSTAKLAAAVDALRESGHEVETITGGGTGSFASDVSCGILNEIQPGSYLFMDRQYREALGVDPDGAFERSLCVQAQVISVNAPAFVTVDAGLKAFATEGPAPRPVTQGYEEAKYAFMGDEHGAVTRPTRDVAPGERIEFEVPHCDPTVDRYDGMYLVRGDVLIDWIEIEARGRSQ
jgi:D-serine deaminase-like pyridoxal phosphate-dependent protein